MAQQNPCRQATKRYPVLQRFVCPWAGKGRQAGVVGRRREKVA